MERIIVTAISIIESRINSHWSSESFLWNVANKSPLSPLWIDHKFSDLNDKFPSYFSSNIKGFTAVITISRVVSTFHLSKFLKASLMISKYVQKIFIIWTLKSTISPQIIQIANLHASLITVSSIANLSQHFRFNCCNNLSISTDAIFQFDPESNLLPEEVRLN